jgi:hypothetical protein
MRSLLVIEYIPLITTLLSIKAKAWHPKIGNGKDLKSGLKTVGGGHHYRINTTQGVQNSTLLKHTTSAALGILRSF